MNYDYAVKIDLEEKEKEAVNVLVQAYDQCTIDDHFECEDCPFYIEDNSRGCLPFVSSLFKMKKGGQL